MKYCPGLLALLLLLLTAVSASGDDRQNAQKQVRKIAAMATDKVGRRMVSASIADSFRLPRTEMVEQRRQLALDYGSFFLAYELMGRGGKLPDIAPALNSGQTIWQIADDRHADWKQITADAKKLNGRIEDSIYRHFLNKKTTDADDERDRVEKYSIVHDAVRTDFNVSEQEMIEAQQRYIFWRDLAGKAQGPPPMTARERQAAAMDHADSRHDTRGIAAPSAGGIPQ